MTARYKGGRAACRGAENKIKSGNMALTFIRDAEQQRRYERLPTPKEALLQLREMLYQCTLAYNNTGSWTAKKKIVLIQERIKELT
jgi:hypothetical protein